MESEIIKIVFLAIIQGITEFLPISSSGHLVITQHFLRIEEDNLFIAVVLHAGTLFSIIAYYIRDLIQLLKWENRKIIIYIVIGTLPLVVGGFIIKPIMDTHFSSLWVAGVGLACTAVILLLLHTSKTQSKELVDMRWFDALLIGLFQCAAITPGISRSGSTISIATRLGFASHTAARFSFFLGIPGILGAIVLTLRDLYEDHLAGVPTVSISLAASILGFLLSFVVGYFSLKILIHTLTTNKFSYFGYYCLTLAVGIVLLQILR